MKIQQSSEDYLEMILILSKKNGYARSIDIASELSVTKPSVSYATKRLRENGYINMDDQGQITLTKTGMEIATRMYERHRLLAKFLINIGVDAEIAKEDACKIEHDLSEESFDAICRHAGFERNQN